MTMQEIPVNQKRGMATVALIFGILSLTCFGPLAGIPAIILGCVVLSRTGRDPVQYGGRGLGMAGLITGSIGTVLGFCVVPLLLAILLPSLGRARELANRSRDAASIRQLGLALSMYTTDNAGAFPSSIAAAAQSGAAPQDFILKDSTTTPPVFMPPVKDWHTLAPDIEAHTDVIYTGADLKASGDPTIIVLYSKDVYMRHEGRILLFADGTVQFVRAANLPAMFDASNAARARLGLPAVSLDGPVPTPGDGTP